MQREVNAMTIAPDPTPGSTAWPELHRQRRAIVVVDVVESVRLMQAHEADVIDRWRRFVNEVRTQVLPAQGGRLVKSLGDGLLLEFDQVPPAVAAAMAMQRSMRMLNAGRDASAAMRLRIGVHLADVVIDEFDIYGSGVNLAARLASLADPGGTVVSEPVCDALVPGLDPTAVDLGECYLKHLDAPVRAYRLATEDADDVAAFGTDFRASPLAATLIVLPMETSGDAAESSVVGDVITDSLIAALAARPELHVISRLSSSALAGRGRMPDRFLQSLGATFALAGSCRVVGDRVAVSLELLETRRGNVVWNAIRRERVAALLTAGCELIERACVEVAAAIAQVETFRAATQPLPSLESHALQVGAVTIMHRSARGEFERARLMLEHLIDRHSRIAAPRAWLAKWYVLRVTRGLVENPAEEARRALEHTRRALDADPGCALALAMEGFVHCHLLRDLDTAGRRLTEATSIGPNEPLAWLLRGVVHAFRDEGSEAVACTERALKLSPIDPLRYYFESLAAAAAVAAGQYQRAIDLSECSLRGNLLHMSTYRTLAIAQSLAGQEKAAQETTRRMLGLDPGFTIERFLARVPAGDSPIGRRFAEALQRAGVPRAGLPR
jgi:adenylate cyclase